MRSLGNSRPYAISGSHNTKFAMSPTKEEFRGFDVPTIFEFYDKLAQAIALITQTVSGFVARSQSHGHFHRRVRTDSQSRCQRLLGDKRSGVKCLSCYSPNFVTCAAKL
jgi:hypothetical protein